LNRIVVASTAQLSKALDAPTPAPPSRRKAAPAPRREAPAVSAPLDLSNVEEQIGFRLRLAQVAVFRNFVSLLKPFELRPSLYSALLVIEANPGRKQQEVGEALGIKRPNLVVLIDELERRGLVKRHRSPGDGRSYALRLTAGGVQAMREIKALHVQHEQRLMEAIGVNGKRLLADLAKLAAIDT
jgi:DNA-binding MarR family transcriptional regulator